MSTTRISVGGDYDVVIGTACSTSCRGWSARGSSGCSWGAPPGAGGDGGGCA